jgi:uncharacterized protein (DUF2141 family)
LTKTFISNRLLLILFIFIIQSSSVYSQVHNNKIIEKGTLKIKITGFENDTGKCWFALDNSKEIYESEDSVFIGKILPIKNKIVELTIGSLEYGIYAIKVFHDENDNGKLDTDFLGIPTERYGYSNNVSAWFGAPGWDRAKFIFNQPTMQIEISVD